MRSFVPVLLAVVALIPNGACARIGGFDYAPQYDFSEFYAATDGKTFQVIVSGNPFPSLSEDDMRRRLLPILQANRPRPRLTFTYSPPVEEPRPYYRLVLLFDVENSLTAQRVCSGQTGHKPGTPGQVNVFAVYCRNDQMMSQALATAHGNAPEDAEVSRMFHDLFLVVFTDQPMFFPFHGRHPFFLR
jgi:hypothetical protein